MGIKQIKVKDITNDNLNINEISLDDYMKSSYIVMYQDKKSKRIYCNEFRTNKAPTDAYNIRLLIENHDQEVFICDNMEEFFRWEHTHPGFLNNDK